MYIYLVQIIFNVIQDAGDRIFLILLLLLLLLHFGEASEYMRM